MDFQFDATADGRRLKFLNVIDEHSRLCLAIRVGRRCKERGADFLLTVKANQKTLHRQIRSLFQGKRKIPFVATDHEIGDGRDNSWMLRAKQAPEHITEVWIGTSWIVEVTASRTRDDQPFHATHLFLTSLSTTQEALLQLVPDRWRI